VLRDAVSDYKSAEHRCGSEKINDVARHKTVIVAGNNQFGQCHIEQNNTAPLENHLETINDGLVGVSNGLKLVDENLFDVNESLGAVAGHLGIGSSVKK
jgi:hypothetical protein